MSTFDNFNNSMMQQLSFLDDRNVVTGILIVLVLYAVFVAPRLSYQFARVFDNVIFKLVIFFLIVYLTIKSPVVGVIATIAFFMSLETLNKYRFGKEMMNVAHHNSEHQCNCASENCKCGGDSNKCTCEGCHCGNHNSIRNDIRYLKDPVNEEAAHVTLLPMGMTDPPNGVPDPIVDQIAGLENELVATVSYEENPYMKNNIHHEEHAHSQPHVVQEHHVRGEPTAAYGLTEKVINELTKLKDDIFHSDVNLKEKAAHIIEEAKRIEHYTGRKVTHEEIKSLCARMDDSLSKSSLSVLDETYHPYGKEISNGYEYAAV